MFTSARVMVTVKVRLVDYVVRVGVCLKVSVGLV